MLFESKSLFPGLGTWELAREARERRQSSCASAPTAARITPYRSPISIKNLTPYQHIRSFNCQLIAYKQRRMHTTHVHRWSWHR